MSELSSAPEERANHRTNAILAAILLLIGVAVYWFLIPFGVRDQPGHGLPPRFFPQLWALCLIAISLIHLFVVLLLPLSREGRAPVEIWTRGQKVRGALAGTTIMVYILFAIEAFGFYTSTAAFLIFGFLLLGERSPLRILLIPMLLLSGIYALFEWVLNVILPRGMFW